jgi:hypothetical protein
MRAELEGIARAARPLLAGVLLGLAIGGLWTLLQPDRHRAEAHLLLGGGPASRLGPAVETLANGSVLEQNVRQTLRLPGRPDLSAAVHGNVVTVSAEARDPERARQVDAEAVQVLTQLAAARFGSQGLRTTLLDPAHVVEQTSPTPARNLLICGLLGLVAGAGFAYPHWRRGAMQLRDSFALDPSLERRLQRRIDEVTKRERALARGVGELAARERDLDQQSQERDSRLRERESQVARGLEELERLRAELETAHAQPAPETHPTAVPEVAGAPLVDETGWGLETLQEIARREADYDPRRREELADYLAFLKDHADPAGRLPRRFDSLIAEIFGVHPGDSPR